MKIQITITWGWHSAIVKVGSYSREYLLPGGFKKYTLVEHLRRANYLDKAMTFDSSMVGFSALYAFVTDSR